MRGIIHDQVSHVFIEGPIQSKPVNCSWNDEKSAHYAGLIQGYEEVDATDIDIPFYQVNERYE